jgi:circadian clock protein KaiC
MDPAVVEDANANEDGAPVPSGIDTLDEILAGGFALNRSHLVEGQPGAGKTTLALQFLIHGQHQGEQGLYITLSESPAELRHVAGTHGMNIAGIEIFELIPTELSLDPKREQSVLYASELELGETVQLVKEAVAATNPKRVVFDSLSEIRLLAGGALRYRRQVLALKNFFAQHGCTVLFLDDLTDPVDDLNLHSLAHGVLRLEHLAKDYGVERRRLRVHKMRARPFRGGYHDFVIRTGGIELFPRIAAGTVANDDVTADSASSGITALDELTGGGLDRGTVTLVQGPAGSGKSSLVTQFLCAAIERGEQALVLAFDESRTNFRRRAGGMGMPVDRYLEEGRLIFRSVDPAEMSPGELANLIKRHVEQGCTAVSIDSLSGYQHAMPDENHILLQMHELLSYLNQRGVLTFLVLSQAGIVGTMRSSVDISYLADAVLLVRFFEADGVIRRALSVVKKRTGAHERSIRELFFDSRGVQVGPQLSQFDALLTGTPRRRGKAGADAGLRSRGETSGG